MMLRKLLLGIVFSLVGMSVLPAFASDTLDRDKCRLRGHYGFSFNGTGYAEGAAVPFTETGFIEVEANGMLSGEVELAFYFADFQGSGQPLWLLVHETQEGNVWINKNSPCTGNIEFDALATVVKTSNPAFDFLVGKIFYKKLARSIAYTVSGEHYNIVDFVSTSPGTIASGTGRKQGK